MAKPKPKKEAAGTHESDDDDDEDDEANHSDDDKTDFGIGKHISESWREAVPFEKFKDTDFSTNPEAKLECCKLIVDDMTTHFTCGIVIPQDAKRNFRGPYFHDNN